MPKPNLDEDILSLLTEVVGPGSIELFQALRGRYNVSEFKIADKLGLSVNEVRNVLYRLQEHSLVSSTRRKDKNKGWYIYYWTFNLKRARSLALKNKKERLENLRKRLDDQENKNFYVCKYGHVKFSGDQALEYGFRCPECSKVLIEQKENPRAIRREIEFLEKELGKAKT